MLLIDLPPELLQLILRYSTTPSFVQLIRTCHTLFDLASQSRDVVKHHLNNIPGDQYVLSVDGLSTYGLFLDLRRRAAATLHGVNISADRHDFHFRRASIDVHASCISSTNDANIALVRRHGSSVQLYQASQGELKLSGVVDRGSEKDAKYQPLHTTFDQMNNLYVLYCLEETVESAERDHPLVEPSAETTTARMCLTRVRLSALSSPHDSWDIDGDLVLSASSVRPVSMAAYGGNKVSVAWDTNTCVNHARYISIELFTLYKDRETQSVFINDLPKDTWTAASNTIDPPEHCKYPASRIVFSGEGRALKCYSPAFAAPSCRIFSFQRHSTSNVTVNKMRINLDAVSSQWFFVEDPFFGYHETIPSTGSCFNIRLSLAAIILASQYQSIACILRSSETTPEDYCTHAIDLDEHHAMASAPSSRIVARLWGLKFPITTMPAVMAYSEKGTRIAIAYWDRIFVWPLLPKALAEAGRYHQDVYKKTYDSYLKCNLVELKPIVLKADAVIHKMAFAASEDELVTITDRGLQMWNLGPSATGRRSVELLHDDENGEMKEGTGKQEERQDSKDYANSCHAYSSGGHPAAFPSINRRQRPLRNENRVPPPQSSAEDPMDLSSDCTPSQAIR